MGGGGGSINNSSDRSDAARLRFVLTPIKIFGKQWVGNELNKRVEKGRGRCFIGFGNAAPAGSGQWGQKNSG